MKSSRSKRMGRIGLLMATASLALGLTASAASASVNVTPEGPYFEEEVVTVWGTAPATAAIVAVAVCNAEYEPGTHCDSPSAAFDTKAAYEGKEISIPIRIGPWPNFDFTKGIPPAKASGETTCKSVAVPANDQCEIQVSYYDGTFKRVGEDTPVPILFE